MFRSLSCFLLLAGCLPAQIHVALSQVSQAQVRHTYGRWAAGNLSQWTCALINAGSSPEGISEPAVGSAMIDAKLQWVSQKAVRLMMAERTKKNPIVLVNRGIQKGAFAGL